MVMQRVEIELPESIYRQLAQIAKETAQPIATIAAKSVVGNLPPSVEEASPELRSELLKMQTLETPDLLEIAQATMDSDQHKRQVELLTKNQDNQLTDSERQEMLSLRQLSDQLMLRKAYAWSVLRWRGQRVPSINELPIPQ